MDALPAQVPVVAVLWQNNWLLTGSTDEHG